MDIFQGSLLEQETDRLRTFAQFIAKIAAAPANEHDIDRVFSMVLEQITQIIAVSVGAITLVENNSIRICVASDVQLNRARGSDIPRTEEPFRHVLTTSTPYVGSYVVGQDQLNDGLHQEYLVVPLIWNGRVRGVVELVSQPDGAFDETDLALVQTIATLLSGRVAEADRVRLLQAEVIRHERSVGRIAAQYMVTRILSEASGFMDVAEAILQTIGEQLGWETGLMWCVQSDTNMLRCTATWSAPNQRVDHFMAVSRDLQLSRGVGLPGDVWERQEPLWIPDVLNDQHFRRSAAARQANLHAAFAFPIVGHNIFFGVIEFFSRSIQQPDAELLHTTAALGRQMGQFIERKRAQRAQQESEQYTRAMLETALDGIIAIDQHGRVTEWNPAAEHMFGYQRADVLGKELGPLIVPPVLRDQHQTGLTRYLASGDAQVLGRRLELPAIRADGTEFPVELSITRVPGAGAARFTGYVRDITERKQAEEAIRFQAHLLDVVEQAVIATDINGNISYWNRFAERLYGWTANEIIGRNRLELTPDPASQKQVAQMMDLLRAGESISAEVIVQRRDGVSFPAMIIDSPMRDTLGAVVGMVGVSQDISTAKHAERAQRFLVEASARLSASLYYLTTLQHVADLAVLEVADWFTVDLHHDDGTLRQIAGAARDATHNTLIRGENAQKPFDRYVAQVLESGQPECLSSNTSVFMDNNELSDVLDSLGLTSLMIVPMQLRGETIGLITVATASRRCYDHFDLAMMQSLASRAAMAVDNGRLYQNARAAVQLRDEFLSIASHELKTPLTAMLVHSQTLQRRVVRQQSFGERDQTALQVIVDQTLRLNKQIGTLLDVSRIELGQFRLEQTRVDLGALTTRVIAELEPTLERHVLVFTCSESGLVVNGDVRLLEQVLQNLLGNAVKYSPNGGNISVQLERKEAMACLSVSDEGMGIPESARPYLFQRFYRADNVDAHHISGLGIGLYVVQEIVAQHKGTIAVTSAEGVGSSFTVQLPLAGTTIVSG